MRNLDIHSQIKRLESLIERVDIACGDNIELQAEWAKYICILSAGLLENALKEFYVSYAQKSLNESLGKYMSSQISKINNPKSDKFIAMAAAFKEEWRSELEIFMDIKGRGDAITSIMVNRHLIAHGKSRSSDISMRRIEDYLKAAVQVLDKIEEQCLR